MITVPMSAQMYQTMVANIQHLPNGDGTVCITPMQVHNVQHNTTVNLSLPTPPHSSTSSTCATSNTITSTSANINNINASNIKRTRAIECNKYQSNKKHVIHNNYSSNTNNNNNNNNKIYSLERHSPYGTATIDKDNNIIINFNDGKEANAKIKAECHTSHESCSSIEKL